VDLTRIALDRSGVPNPGLAGILSGVPAGPPLVQQVPALIEQDLQLASALAVGVGCLLAGFPLEQLVLLASELVDPGDDVLVVQGSLPHPPYPPGVQRAHPLAEPLRPFRRLRCVVP
jgi:hypothetical protein